MRDLLAVDVDVVLVLQRRAGALVNCAARGSAIATADDLAVAVIGKHADRIGHRAEAVLRVLGDRDALAADVVVALVRGRAHVRQVGNVDTAGGRLEVTLASSGRSPCLVQTLAVHPVLVEHDVAHRVELRPDTTMAPLMGSPSEMVTRLSASYSYRVDVFCNRPIAAQGKTTLQRTRYQARLTKVKNRASGDFVTQVPRAICPASLRDQSPCGRTRPQRRVLPPNCNEKGIRTRRRVKRFRTERVPPEEKLYATSLLNSQ